jgi:hypothetical protein
MRSLGAAQVGVFDGGQMLKITGAANREEVFTVSGRLGAENLAELKTQFSSEASGRRILLDLRELTLVDQDAVSFLVRCEAENIHSRIAQHIFANGSQENETQVSGSSG